MKSFRHLLMCAGLLSLSLFAQSSRSPVQAARSNHKTATLSANYGKLPLGFERNAGQTDARVQWLARSAGYTFFLTSTEAVLRTSGATSAVLRMRLRGANRSARWQASEALPGVNHFFIGNEARQWRTNLKQFARVQAAAVYPGIDLVWYGNQRQLEYDFLLAPHADATRIAWQLDGASCLQREADGSLVVTLSSGETLRWLKPQAWQTINGARQKVECEYAIRQTNEVTFRLGAYDKSQPLVIDPVLAYSTYLGGTGNEAANGVAVDAAGNAYVTGTTASTDFPGASALQSLKGAQNDAFVMKLNPAGNAVIYQTWLGGGGNDVGNKIAVDASGNAVVVGTTTSGDFPLSNALQTTLKGGNDAFVTKLNAAGSALLFSTYLGGDSSETGAALTLDANGNVYVTGATYSTDFPLQNSWQSVKQGSLLHTSANAGGAWSALGSGLNAVQINHLAVDPKTATTLYAATERGVFKSTSSGAMWALLADTPFSFATQVVIDPVTPTTLYVMAGTALYQSVDGGVTWNLRPAPSGPRFLVIDPLTPTTLYATASGQHIIKSTDGGATWMPQTLPPRFGGASGLTVFALAIDAQTPQTLLAASNRGLFKTTNGGAAWSMLLNGLPPPETGAFFSGHLAISRTQSAVALFHLNGFNGAGFYKTVDGGNNWQLLFNTNSSVSSNALIIDPTNANIAYASTNAGLLKTTDGGATWSATNNGLGSLAVRALALAPNLPTTLYAGVTITADAFVTKLSANGGALLYSTYLGGAGNDNATGVAVDATGNAYVGGTTQSANFPGVNGFQTLLKGAQDAFVAKLNPAGNALVWSSYFGGDGIEQANSLAINSSGNVFLAGLTSSTNLPVAKAAQPTNRSTQGETGEAFVTRFSADGKTLDYSTYLGGGNFDQATAIAVDSASNAYVTGITSSRDFPLANAVQSLLGNTDQFVSQDAFVTKLSADGMSLLYSTFLGGASYEQGNGVAVDSAGSAYVAGVTTSTDFPTTPNPLRATPGQQDAFITKLSLNADLALTMTDAPDPVMVNNPLTLTLTVTNNGPDPAVGITLTPTLPNGVTFNTLVSSQGTCTNAAPLTCALGALAARATATVTLTITPTATATLTTRANVTSISPDLNTTNNAATQETRVVATPSIYGRVTAGGAGLRDVTMAMSGAQRPVTTTNATGDYQFAELSSSGNYTVTPQRAGYVFNPPARSFDNVTRDQRGDFAAVACAFTLSQRTQSFQAVGGMGSVTMTATDPQCAWTARSNAPWLTLNSAASGNGTTTVRFTVAPTVTARQGSIQVGGQVLGIFQEFNACATVRLGEVGQTLLQIPQGSYGFQPFLVQDFNQDGQPDLIVINSSVEQTLQFLTGTPDGRFIQPVNLHVINAGAGQFSALHAADFNSDGRLDLVAVSGDRENSGRVWILNGDGTGQFSAAREFMLANANNPANTVAVGDLNGDHKTDLAIGLNGAPYATILLNDGAGGMQTARNLANSPANFQSFNLKIDIADFDGDGKTDLLLRQQSYEVRVYKGDGAGNFTAQPNQAFSFEGTSTSGDFNRDGKPDLAFLSSDRNDNQRHFRVQLNDGTGRFTTTVRTPMDIPFTGDVPTLLSADFTQDGNLDIAITASGSNQTFRKSLWFMTGNGNGNFAPRTLHLTPNISGGQLVAADFNRDGKPDLYLMNFVQLSSVITANATGLNAPRAFRYSNEYGGSVSAAVAGDVNHDGVSDLVVATYAKEAVWLAGTGRSAYGAPVPINGANRGVAAMALHDFNRDGRLDLAIVPTNTATVEVLLNQGKGDFRLHTTLNVGTRANKLAIGDFNKDGAPDLVTNGQAGGLALYLNNGQALFTPNATDLGGNQAGSIFAVGDFNGDGQMDVVLPDPNTTNSQSKSRLFLLPGNGQGSFGTTQFVETNALVNQLLAYDLNLDGRDDLIYRTDTIQVALSNGAGGYQPAQPYTVQRGGLSSVQVADLNGDGKPDLAASNDSGTYFATGKGDGTFNAFVTFEDPNFSGISFITDVDEDGDVDGFSFHATTPAFSIFTNRTSCIPPSGAVVTSAASYAPHRIANDSINTLFGANLTNVTQSAATLPLPTILGGVSLRLRDSAGLERLAPLFFVSPGQINYLTPVGLAPGVLIFTVLNGSNAVATGTTLLAVTAPGLFSTDATGRGIAAAVVLRVRANGAQVYESIARLEQGRVVAVPIDVSNATEQVFLILYGTGLRNRNAAGTITLTANGTPLEVPYAGAQGSLAGLDQLNVRLPAALAGRGQLELQLLVDGRAANPVNVSIK